MPLLWHNPPSPPPVPPPHPDGTQKENQSLRQEREAAEASMFEIQQKAIRAQEDMASAMRMRPASSASAPNLPGLTGGAARQAGAEADARWATVPAWLAPAQREDAPFRDFVLLI